MTTALGLALALSIYVGLPYAASALSAESPAKSASGGAVTVDVPLGRAAPDGGSAVRTAEAPITKQPVSLAVANDLDSNSGFTARTIPIARSAPLTVERDAQDVELAVAEAAREFGVDGTLLLCVARTESGLRVDALGHKGERGLMQFMARTWGYYARESDGTARWTGNAARLGYSESDVWSAIPAARVAAEMFSRHQGWQWTTHAGCAR